MAVSRPTSFPAAKFKRGKGLTPTGDARIFTFPSNIKFLLNLAHNGLNLEEATTDDPSDGEFLLFESVPGDGFDSIKLLRWTPNSRSQFTYVYIEE